MNTNPISNFGRVTIFILNFFILNLYMYLYIYWYFNNFLNLGMHIKKLSK
jgi:hypothetical protein